MAINTITEDFETGMRIQSKGYRTFALARPLAHGMAPHTIPSLIAQRDRWGRGCIQSLKNVKPFFRRGLSFAAKASYLACAVYWWTFTRRFVYIAVPIVAVLFHVQVVECTIQQILLFWLPYYLLTNQSLKVLSGHTRNQHWNNLIDTIMFPYLIAPIVLETLGVSKKKFVVTSKKRKQVATGPSRPVIYALPHIVLLAASVLALSICVIQVINTAALYNIIIMFWLVINCKNLFFAICFMIGRDNHRKADRFYVNLPIVVEHQGKQFSGITTDISETGVSALLNFPIYLPDNQKIKLVINTDRYHAEMDCQIVHVDPPKEKTGRWRFCLQIVDISDQSRSAYSQIVFDRVHTLPRQINEANTIYDDLKDNIEKRLNAELERAIRKYPRIPLGIKSFLEDGSDILIHDFNYKFVWLKADSAPGHESFEVECAPQVKLKLQKVDEVRESRNGGSLYHVLNLNELLESKYFEAAIMDWVRLAKVNEAH